MRNIDLQNIIFETLLTNPMFLYEQQLNMFDQQKNDLTYILLKKIVPYYFLHYLYYSTALRFLLQLTKSKTA